MLQSIANNAFDHYAAIFSFLVDKLKACGTIAAARRPSSIADQAIINQRILVNPNIQSSNPNEKDQEIQSRQSTSIMPNVTDTYNVNNQIPINRPRNGSLQEESKTSNAYGQSDSDGDLSVGNSDKLKSRRHSYHVPASNIVSNTMETTTDQQIPLSFLHDRRDEINCSSNSGVTLDTLNMPYPYTHVEPPTPREEPTSSDIYDTSSNLAANQSEKATRRLSLSLHGHRKTHATNNDDTSNRIPAGFRAGRRSSESAAISNELSNLQLEDNPRVKPKITTWEDGYQLFQNSAEGDRAIISDHNADASDTISPPKPNSFAFDKKRKISGVAFNYGLSAELGKLINSKSNDGKTLISVNDATKRMSQYQEPLQVLTEESPTMMQSPPSEVSDNMYHFPMYESSSSEHYVYCQSSEIVDEDQQMEVITNDIAANPSVPEMNEIVDENMTNGATYVSCQ